MSTAEDLGKLIIMMNPYAGGSMEPHTFLSADPPTDAATPPSGTETSSTETTATHARHIWMEMDRYGTGDWSFKGQPRRVDMGLRIAYRWAKKDRDGKVVCWITDYLLIGYEGSNGG